jgi:hypothetical protein
VVAQVVVSLLLLAVVVLVAQQQQLAFFQLFLIQAHLRVVLAPLVMQVVAVKPLLVQTEFQQVVALVLQL